ncbi:ADA32 protein, partial [Ramphastos sulfuratus]|nr:ADA32 protein [Ramphastos sulfuratus]
QGDCHYRGYVEGFPSSAVTLSTCTGLRLVLVGTGSLGMCQLPAAGGTCLLLSLGRGLLQFANVSYGIEALGSSPGFKHFVYPVSDKGTAEPLLASSHLQREMGRLEEEEMAFKARGDKEVSGCLLPWGGWRVPHPRRGLVLQEALSGHRALGEGGQGRRVFNSAAVPLFSFQMFHPLNLTILLSSLEVWTQENKISTALEAHQLQPRFVQWKQLSRAQPVHDLALLLLYKAQAASTGATMQGTACQSDAGVVAVYQRFMTVESFSVLLTQLLGHSLGMSYDDAHHCHCHRHTCIMSHMALFTEGTKAFSNCSIKDFETFLKQKGSSCLFSRGSWRRLSFQAAKCGNGVVEPGEQCDCGAGEACSKDKCCTKTCRFQPGVKCSSGLCCSDCQFKQQNTSCRLAADPECDLPEVCTGSSASCPPDLYLQDGHSCGDGTGYCYKGRCQSPELQCQLLYGRGSKSAPTACYEELNSQKDRFGHCGFHPRSGYRSCVWRDLRCGKLICTYPSSTPFPSQAAAVVYARVRQHLCVSLHYLNTSAQRDPMLVPPGTKCGSGKLCINNTCHPLSVLALECDSAVNCHGHGVCDNKGQCHCQPDWQPPDCSRRVFRLQGGS